MHTSGKILSNTLIQVIGKLVSTVIGVLVLALQTRFLGAIGYGQFAQALFYVQLAGIVADFGLYMVLAKELNRPGADTEKIVGNVMGLRLVAGGLVLLVASVLAFGIYTDPMIRFGIPVLAIAILSTVTINTLLPIYQQHLSITRFTLAEIFGRVVLLVGTWLVAAFATDARWIFVPFTLANVVNLTFVYAGARKWMAVRPRFDRVEWKRLTIIAAPLAASVAFNAIYFKIDTLLLGKLVADQAVVGQYGAAYRLLEVAIVFPAMFAGFVFPPLTQAWEQGKRDEFSAKLSRAMEAMLVLAAPLVVLTWAVATPLMVAIGRSDFAASGPILNVLILAAATIFLGNVFGNTVVTVGKQKVMTAVYAAVAVGAVALYLIMIPLYGAFGAAWSTLIVELMVTISAGVLVARTSGWRPSLRNPFIIVFAAATGGILAFTFREWSPVAAAVISLGWYTVCIVVGQVVPLDLLKSMLKRSDV